MKTLWSGVHSHFVLTRSWECIHLMSKINVHKCSITESVESVVACFPFQERTKGPWPERSWYERGESIFSLDSYFFFGSNFLSILFFFLGPIFFGFLKGKNLQGQNSPRRTPQNSIQIWRFFISARYYALPDGKIAAFFLDESTLVLKNHLSTLKSNTKPNYRSITESCL